jgi:hypothetical protein
MAVKTCIVSYWDTSCQYSVEVVAESLHEAAILGIKAMKISLDRLHLINLDVAIKEPAVHRSISGAMLSAWLAHPGKNKKEDALKQRLGDLLRS